MDCEHAIEIVDAAVSALGNAHLNDLQREVFCRTWQKQGYREIAAALGYTEGYIKQDVGHKLWKLLSQAFGDKVTKKNLQSATERYAKQGKTVGLNQKASPVLTLPSAANRPFEYWGELKVGGSNLYGRSLELNELTQEILTVGQRLLLLYGMGGIGKTALAQKLVEQIKPQFDYVFFESLATASTPTALLTQLLQFLQGESQAEMPPTLEGQIACLLRLFRQHRCLVILDDAQQTTLARQLIGFYRPECQGYKQLLQKVVGSNHHSCLLWITREEPRQAAMLRTYGARLFRLSGLNLDDGRCWLESKGEFVGAATDWSLLMTGYQGNPLMLGLIADVIQNWHGGQLTTFVNGPLQLTEALRELLDEHFARLSDLEQALMYWLAIASEPLSLTELQAAMMLNSVPAEAMASLLGRSLCLNADKTFNATANGATPRFMQFPVVQAYVVERLQQQVKRELETEVIDILGSHALMQAKAKEQVKEKQRQQLLKPIAESLAHICADTGEAVTQKLERLGQKIRHQFGDTPNYAAGNLINLSCQLDVDLTGFNFSRLSIRQADLRHTDLHNVNFSKAELSQSVFAQALGRNPVIAISQDGGLLATGDDDGRILLWQIADGQEACVILTEFHQPIQCLAFSPAIDYLAAGDTNGHVALWRIQTSQNHPLAPIRYPLAGHERAVRCLCFSPTHQLLASGSDDTTIRLWDLRSGALRLVLRQHETPVHDLNFSPDGNTLISCSDNNTVRLWQVSTGDCQVTIPRAGTCEVKAVAFQRSEANASQRSNRAMAITAAVVDDHTVVIWQEATQSKIYRTLPEKTEPIITLAFSPDGHSLATTTAAGMTQVWCLKTGQSIIPHPVHVHAKNLAISPDNQILISTSPYQVQLWQIKTGRRLQTLKGRWHPVCTFAFCCSNAYFASAHPDHVIRLWAANENRYLKRLKGHDDWVWTMAFSPGGEFLASGGDGQVRLWQTTTGQCLLTRPGHTDVVRSVSFSADGRLLASASDDQTLILWDVATRRELIRLSPRIGRLHTVCFSPNGQYLACGSRNGMLQAWSLETHQPLWHQAGHSERVHTLAFSPDSCTLASGSYDGSAQLWTADTGQPLEKWEQISSRIYVLGFEPQSGEALVVSSETQTSHILILRNLKTGEQIKVFERHQAEMHQACFSADGQHLASCSQRGEIYIWSLATGRVLTTLRVDRPYEGMDITGTRERQAQALQPLRKTILKALGAIEH
ncbi:MAG: NACHT domain-containing protein [Cyanothece sp. SIO1E1]|nr:NACHT domain-containing protein [Cyanothece sp. SIO1E1]